ncbi:MAG TPA: cyclic pyranopterin monophosphate synthase MoaC [Planctomycetota bacterium]|nr:cyclic pyranopterin monophosphate synthase MoaC [Planctomycetota bacterium]
MGRRLTHVGPDGAARMVDVAGKEPTHRVAVAEARVRMKPATLRTIRRGGAAKGNVLEIARIAGIQAAKQTSALIPLCHPLALTRVAVDLTPEPPGGLRIEARAEALDRTGVEMEALTAAAVAGLTVYDMCKAIDREMEIGTIRLLEKSGGKSGPFMRAERRKRKR